MFKKNFDIIWDVPVALLELTAFCNLITSPIFVQMTSNFYRIINATRKSMFNVFFFFSGIEMPFTGKEGCLSIKFKSSFCILKFELRIGQIIKLWDYIEFPIFLISLSNKS